MEEGLRFELLSGLVGSSSVSSAMFVLGMAVDGVVCLILLIVVVIALICC